MIFTCRAKTNIWDGEYHPVFIWYRHLDNGKCIVAQRVMRAYTEIAPGGWAGGQHWRWSYRTMGILSESEFIGSEVIHD